MPFYFPTFDTDNSSRDFQEQFGGYNHNIKIGETEFYDMKNMTGDYFPVLSPRSKRGLLKQGDTSLSNFGGMICKEKLCYIDNGKLYIDNKEITAFSKAGNISKTEYKKEMVSMGAYLVIFNRTYNEFEGNRDDSRLEDGWYINTQDLTDYGYLQVEKVYRTGSDSVASAYIDSLEFELETVDREGHTFEADYISLEKPEPEKGLKNGEIWEDISAPNVPIFKKWSSTQNMWVTITDVYTKIKCSISSAIPYPRQYHKIASDLSVGDAIYLNFFDITEFSSSLDNYIKSDVYSDENCIATIKNTFNLKPLVISHISKDKTEIVVPGVIEAPIFKISVGRLSICKMVPLMDFVCESNNRLWGCRYGKNNHGKIVNEIYACKQGDFKNWFCYAGVSTDSYAVSVGSDGPWTGCIPYGSSVYFFKENSVHKLYGTIPANYQLIEQKLRGVQKGSEKSLCVVNETLFYKSATDFCYYDGSVPVSISNALGKVRYSDVICSTIKTKVYINAKDSENRWHLFVYDIATGLWHKEDNIQLRGMCRVDTDLYYVDIDGNLGTFTGTGAPEDDFQWYAETGNIGYSYNDNKYIERMSLRVQKTLTSEIKLLISYDDSDTWELVSYLQGQGIQTYSIPIMPRRCDHFRLRLEGKGDCKVFSLSKTIEIGSDI